MKSETETKYVHRNSFQFSMVKNEWKIKKEKYKQQKTLAKYIK